jgi:AcrR family transcriptional regulator
MSVGALRHYFGTQEELLAFAMRLVIERARRRIEALELSSCGPRRAVETVLREVLPLDPERMAEAEVWLAFTGKALADPALRALRDESYDLLWELCRRLVRMLVDSRPDTAELNIDLEAERLYAVIDGLAMHAVVRPERVTDDLLDAVLKRHLDDLCPDGDSL